MSKRGIRGTSMRVRVAVAAAVLATGGAAGVLALSASHDSAVNAQSAGFVQSGSGMLSYSSAISSAMRTWDRSPGTSLQTLSHMQQINNYWTQSWHHAVLFFQRGKVVSTGRHEFTVRSANGMTETWYTNRGTAIMNVGGSSTGMQAMTGGSMNMQVPSWWTMDTQTRGLAPGDFVFVFGERENHTLKAQLVLFGAQAHARHPAMQTTTAPAPAPGTNTNMNTTAPAAPPAGNVPTDFGTKF